MLPSELAQLPPLFVLCRVAGWPLVMPWRLAPPTRPQIQAPVVEEADWVSRPIALDGGMDGRGGGHDNDEGGGLWVAR